MVEYDTAHMGGRRQAVFGLWSRRKVLFSDGEIDLCLSSAGFLESGSGIRYGYTFDIYLSGLKKPIGYISLRLGESTALYYLGHIGYRIHAQFRGHAYAAKALTLLIPLMKKEKLLHPVITTNPDNWASRKTCEKLDCILERIAPVPHEHWEVCSGAAYKCRYILCIPHREERES